MENNNLIYVPELLGKVKDSWTEKDFQVAITKFRQNAPAATTPRLYDAYRWLKEKLDTEDEDSSKQFTYFIEHFLRILEERGAVNSETYSEVLRDSAEYKYLRGLFHNDESAPDPEMIEIPDHKLTAPPEIEKISLKDILHRKNISLLDFDINSWYKLIEEYLKEFKAEDLFVKNSLHLVNNIKKRTEKESYHIEMIVVYSFETLLKYKKLSLKSKDFAMYLLNLMINKGETWSRLHREYLEIIKK